MATKRLQRLQDIYPDISDYDAIPIHRSKSKWKNTNKFGFLKGMIEYGRLTQHLTELDNLLVNPPDNPETYEKIDDFIDRVFDFYIRTFHKDQNSRPASRASSRPASRPTTRVASKASSRAASPTPRTRAVPEKNRPTGSSSKLTKSKAASSKAANPSTKVANPKGSSSKRTKSKRTCSKAANPKESSSKVAKSKGSLLKDAKRRSARLAKAIKVTAAMSKGSASSEHLTAVISKTGSTASTVRHSIISRLIL